MWELSQVSTNWPWLRPQSSWLFPLWLLLYSTVASSVTWNSWLMSSTCVTMTQWNAILFCFFVCKILVSYKMPVLAVSSLLMLFCSLLFVPSSWNYLCLVDVGAHEITIERQAATHNERSWWWSSLSKLTPTSAVLSMCSYYIDFSPRCHIGLFCLTFPSNSTHASASGKQVAYLIFKFEIRLWKVQSVGWQKHKVVHII